MCSARASDSAVAACVAQDMDVILVNGCLGPPFNAAYSRQFLDGRLDNAPLIGRKASRDDVRNLPFWPKSVCVFDGIL